MSQKISTRTELLELAKLRYRMSKEKLASDTFKMDSEKRLEKLLADHPEIVDAFNEELRYGSLRGM